MHMPSPSFGAAQDLPNRHRRLRVLLSVAVAATLASAASAERQDPKAAPAPGSAPLMFRSSVNVVSVAAVVRDRRGRVMPSLRREDFEVVDGGERRPVVDVRADASAPASVALLVDGSGSMSLGASRTFSQRISESLLANLDPARDAAALLTFDTRLLTLCEFTRDFRQILRRLPSVEAFGSTALYDAVAGSAALVADRARNRRAVVVLTDGLDNASAYPPGKVAWIASTIDVPVYVFDVGDRPDREGKAGPAPRDALAELARATGGDLFVANTPLLVDAAVKRVAEELRHQYVIAFEGAIAMNDGLRHVEIRTRNPDLKIQARNWYRAADE